MKKIMFCGGGSAGHVIPNIALYEQLRDRYEICYVGTNSIEKSICTKYGLKFYEFNAAKLVRGKIFCNLTLPAKVIKGERQCEEIIKDARPDLLFCKGGYVSFPPAVAANKLGIPVLTHESDINIGLANKLISKKCKRVLTAFPSTASKLKNGIYTGTPLRLNLFKRDKIMAKREYGCDLRPTVIIFGGGSGSKVINSAVRQVAAELCKKYNIIHVCGKGNKVYSNIYGYRQIEYIEDMGTAYAAADYAVARCGANSANELIALKIPTLFIPLQNRRSRGDQIANAEYFKKRGLCHVMQQKELNGNNLLAAIEELIADGKLKTALKEKVFKRGNERIIEEIEYYLK
ncbi:MAG: UDP-N-acetylglucosamine--N-acetylmuramyl-(pentapeptide) pyrophosphoryl-undecaprenol N-acetylglucosamine transferase [Candidatus Coproplasma sp.]